MRRLDANHNGMIDPDEANDAMAKGMLDRIFGQIGKQPHYPVAISEITQGYEAAMRSGGGNGGATPNPGGSSPAAGSGMSFVSPAAASSAGAASSSPSKPVAPGIAMVPAPAVAVPPPPGTAVPPPGPTAVPDAKVVPHKPARFLTSTERLPKGLPDWFLEKRDDAGQVTMARYTNNWTPEKLEEFNRYDLNHDGVITAKECLTVVEKDRASSN